MRRCVGKWVKDACEGEWMGVQMSEWEAECANE